MVHAGEQEGGGEEGPHHLEQRAEGNGGAQGIKPLQFNPNQARQYFFLMVNNSVIFLSKIL